MERRTLTREISVGVAVALIVGLLTFAWNWFSGGGLVRALGGVTASDVESILRTAKPANGLPSGAVVAFDLPGRCPEGWELEDDAVGSAIVGIGATRVGATGEPLRGYDLGRYQYADEATKKPIQTPHMRGHHPPTYVAGKEDDSEPISDFVYGVKTSTQPTFLPLIYCMKK